MTRRLSGREDIIQFLSTLDEWVTTEIDVYLIGGAAMTVTGLKDQTKDIDLVLASPEQYTAIKHALLNNEFTTTAIPTETEPTRGETIRLEREDGYQLDIFEHQIVGRARLTETMQTRANSFWTGTTVSAHILADEDMLFLKLLAAGDLNANRRRDLNEVTAYIRRAPDYDIIINEINAQRPFNTGELEHKHLLSKNHPLICLDRATTSLSQSLPQTFVNQLSDIASESELEFHVLNALHDGQTTEQAIITGLKTHQSHLENVTDRVPDALNRLRNKEIITNNNKLRV